MPGWAKRLTKPATTTEARMNCFVDVLLMLELQGASDMSWTGRTGSLCKPPPPNQQQWEQQHGELGKLLDSA